MFHVSQLDFWIFLIFFSYMTCVVLVLYFGISSASTSIWKTFYKLCVLLWKVKGMRDNSQGTQKVIWGNNFRQKNRIKKWIERILSRNSNRSSFSKRKEEKFSFGIENLYQFMIPLFDTSPLTSFIYLHWLSL